MILGRKENLRREIASLTKVMTFYTVYNILDKYKLDPTNHQIKVTWAAA